jgi:hypothetical protein
MIYQEHLHRPLARLQFEPELFLNGGKDGGAGYAIGGGSRVARFASCVQSRVKSKDPFISVMSVTWATQLAGPADVLLRPNSLGLSFAPAFHRRADAARRRR